MTACSCLGPHISVLQCVRRLWCSCTLQRMCSWLVEKAKSLRRETCMMQGHMQGWPTAIDIVQEAAAPVDAYLRRCICCCMVADRKCCGYSTCCRARPSPSMVVLQLESQLQRNRGLHEYEQGIPLKFGALGYAGKLPLISASEVLSACTWPEDQA